MQNSQHTKHIFYNKCKDCVNVLASSHGKLVSGPLHFHHSLPIIYNIMTIIQDKKGESLRNYYSY